MSCHRDRKEGSVPRTWHGSFVGILLMFLLTITKDNEELRGLF